MFLPNIQGLQGYLLTIQYSRIQLFYTTHQ